MICWIFTWFQARVLEQANYTKVVPISFFFSINLECLLISCGIKMMEATFQLQSSFLDWMYSILLSRKHRSFLTFFTAELLQAVAQLLHWNSCNILNDNFFHTVSDCAFTCILQEAISDFYRFIWNLFYVEYIIFPFI